MIKNMLDIHLTTFKVTTIEKGGYFGELALVTHKPRAATVVADKEVRVACKFIFYSFLLVLVHN